jgi:Uma2 family endonuclease
VEFQQITSLKELILIAQDRPHVERFTRQPNGDWLFHEQKEMTADFELKSLGISVAMSELYRGVKFEPTEEA